MGRSFTFRSWHRSDLERNRDANLGALTRLGDGLRPVALIAKCAVSGRYPKILLSTLFHGHTYKPPFLRNRVQGAHFRSSASSALPPLPMTRPRLFPGLYPAHNKLFATALA
jgi:hypothetical protein